MDFILEASYCIISKTLYTPCWIPTTFKKGGKIIEIELSNNNKNNSNMIVFFEEALIK